MVDEVNEEPKKHFNLKNIEETEKKSKKKSKFKKNKKVIIQEKDSFKVSYK